MYLPWWALLLLLILIGVAVDHFKNDLEEKINQSIDKKTGSWKKS